MGYVARGREIDYTPTPNELFLPGELEDAIRRYLASKGLKYWVVVHLTGEDISEVVIAARGCYKLTGPPPEYAEGLKEQYIRDWLESRGNVLFTSFSYGFLIPYAGVKEEEYRWKVCLD